MIRWILRRLRARPAPPEFTPKRRGAGAGLSRLALTSRRFLPFCVAAACVLGGVQWMTAIEIADGIPLAQPGPVNVEAFP